MLGGCAVFAGNSGLKVEDILIQKDFPIMILTVLACMPIFWTKGRISRSEGGILLGLYIIYLTDQILPYTMPALQSEFRLIFLFLVLPISAMVLIYKAILYWRFQNS